MSPSPSDTTPAPFEDGYRLARMVVRDGFPEFGAVEALDVMAIRHGWPRRTSRAQAGKTIRSWIDWMQAQRDHLDMTISIALKPFLRSRAQSAELRRIAGEISAARGDFFSAAQLDDLVDSHIRAELVRLMHENRRMARAYSR